MRSQYLSGFLNGTKSSANVQGGLIVCEKIQTVCPKHENDFWKYDNGIAAALVSLCACIR